MVYRVTMAEPWDPSLGASRPLPVAPAPRVAPARPRGLPYLESLLTQPRVERKLTSFVRFRDYVERRQKRHSRAGAIDRARARELKDTPPHTVIRRRGDIDLAAATWAVIYALGVATDTSTKTIVEALVSLGLESTSESIRRDGVGPSVKG